jgi:hypothetical protein
MVREEISSLIVNTGKYTVLEREQMNRVLRENSFQTSGAVDDAQISEMGRLLGANYVIASSVAQIGSNYYISCKLIDVATGRIEKQRTAQTQRGTGDLMSAVQKIADEMFADSATDAEKPAQQPATVRINEDLTKPAINCDRLLCKGGKIYRYDMKNSVIDAKGRSVYRYYKYDILTKYDARELLENNNEISLRMYNNSISKNRAGNILTVSGACIAAIGGGIVVSEDLGFNYYSDDVWYYAWGAVCVGGAILLTGITLKLLSVNIVKNSVNIYNDVSMYDSLNKKTAGMELRFGITGNGAVVTLRF